MNLEVIKKSLILAGVEEEAPAPRAKCLTRERQVSEAAHPIEVFPENRKRKESHSSCQIQKEACGVSTKEVPKKRKMVLQSAQASKKPKVQFLLNCCSYL